jgi:hypothetical protein
VAKFYSMNSISAGMKNGGGGAAGAGHVEHVRGHVKRGMFEGGGHQERGLRGRELQACWGGGGG